MADVQIGTLQRCQILASGRQIDLLGRLGGEEFAVALMETDMPAALETAERLRRKIAAEPFQITAGEIQVTVSVGVAGRDRRG